MDNRMQLTITTFVLTLVLLFTPTHSSACWLDNAIESGNISFHDALNGLEIKIAFYPDTLPWSEYDYATNTFTGGYSVDMINAIADASGFIPNLTLVEFKNDSETYTDFAKRALLSHDIAGTWFTDAAERRFLGINFAHHFIDATMVLIIPQPKYEDKKFHLTAFLKPFTAELWILLIFGIIFNAICGFILYILSNPLTRIKCKKCICEREKENGKYLFTSFGSYLYTSFGHFTASGDGFEPDCIWSRINTIMWSFLVVIVLASYTANLATFLISEANVESSLDTIEAIMAANKPICTIIAGIEGQRIKAQWPNLKLIQADLNAGSFLRNGSCAGALLPTTDADVLLAESCDMQLTIQRYFPAGGSFVFQSDENRCGPTIQQLFDYHFVRLEEEGLLAELWAKQVDGIQCQFNEQEVPDHDDSIQLGLYDLGGLSLIYGICAILLIGLKIVYVLVFEKKEKIDEKNDDEKNDDHDIITETELTTHINIVSTAGDVE